MVSILGFAAKWNYRKYQLHLDYDKCYGLFSNWSIQDTIALDMVSLSKCTSIQLTQLLRDTNLQCSMVYIYSIRIQGFSLLWSL